MRGLAIAVPIVVVFAALLASADVVFGRELSALLEALQLQRLPEYVFRLLYIAVAAYALTGVFLHAASQSADDKLAIDGKRLVPQFLGATEASIVLGSVAALFCAFVVVQIQYFFGGQANINVAGYTYAEYARRGYGELVAVAVFSLVMIMGLGAVTRRETATTRRLFSTLSVIVVAFVGVILVSAYQRLRLYELAYGFSRLRTYVHVSLIWVGLLLVAVVLLEILQRERHLMGVILVAALGFVLSLAALNVDGFIVKQNVEPRGPRSGPGCAVPGFPFNKLGASPGSDLRVPILSWSDPRCGGRRSGLSPACAPSPIEPGLEVVHLVRMVGTECDGCRECPTRWVSLH